MPRILFLRPKPKISHKMSLDFYDHLPQNYSGVIIFPVSKKIMKLYRNRVIGRFKCYPILKIALPVPIRICWEITYYLYKALSLHFFNKKFDLIIAYTPLKTGFIGLLLSKLTKAKLIVEIPGNFKKAFILDSETSCFLLTLKSKITNLLVSFIINRADHIKLLYPTQLNGYRNIKRVSQSIFHDFVPISAIKPSEESDQYILFLGFPWYLKGVDILIKAFKLISNEFPEYRLKIVGYCPDKSYFQKLAEGNNKIELCDPVFHDEAMKLMSRCTLFVLPSRTEAMGRVLLEAMASKKPIIASNVDGIPHYIKHGFNGLLFESENVEDLAEKIKIILSNPDYAKKLAENGYNYVHQHLSEERYVECFKKMVDKVLSNKN